jgi:hypothetical protein
MHDVIYCLVGKVHILYHVFLKINCSEIMQLLTYYFSLMNVYSRGKEKLLKVSINCTE